MAGLDAFLTSAPATPAADKPDDDLDAYVAAEARARAATAATATRAANPAIVGRANVLSRSTGLPAETVERNLPEVEGRRRIDEARSAFERDPKLAGWAGDPRNAAVAHDDYPKLARIGDLFAQGQATGWRIPMRTPETIGDKAASVLGNIGGSLMAGVATMNAGLYGTALLPAEVGADAAAGVRSLLGLPAIKNPVVEFLKARRGDSTRVADGARPVVESDIARGLLSGVESLPTTAAAIGFGLMGAPQVGLGAFGVTTGGNAYADAREAGRGITQSAVYGAAQGGTEVATEAAGFGFLVKSLGKVGLPKFLAGFVGRELAGEEVATVVQGFNEWATINPDRPFSEWVAGLPAEMTQTALATVAVAGSVGALNVGVKAAADYSAARTAERDMQFLDDLAAGVDTSETRKRDLTAFESFLSAQAEGTPVERLYIPAETVRALYQSERFVPGAENDELFGFQEDIQDQLEQALATGGDVVIDTAKAVANLAGKPIWEKIKADVRVRPDGVSLRQAADMEAELGDAMRAAGEAAAADAKAEQDAQEPAARVFDDVFTQAKAAGFGTNAARAYADLFAARYSARGAALGIDAKAAYDAANVDIVADLPDTVQSYAKADNLDVLISTMRRKSGDGAKAGPTLAEFISSSGGMPDPTGDLAALGAGEWHKGKPGKRKLIKAEAADAGAPLLGQPGVPAKGRNALQEMAEQAFDAGYFPGLTEAPSPTEFLAALDRDLRGGEVRTLEGERGGDTTTGVRAAADDLRRELEARGVDADTATPAEIKAALAATNDSRVFLQGASESGWARIVDKIFRGDPVGRLVVVGRTPGILRALGLNAADLVMTSGKIAKARREHSDVTRATWQALPSLLANPVAAFASPNNDGALVVVIDAVDRSGDPVLVPIIAEVGGGNVVLSVYGKNDGAAYIARGLASARNNGQPTYERDDFAGTKPQSGSAEAIPSPPAPIAAGGPAKPDRKLLSLRAVVKRDLDQRERARISFGVRNTITLFEGRDLSSLLHESGHLWLEELQFDATTPGATPALQADWATVQAWFTANGHKLNDDGTIPEEAHELFARGFERFLMEGKAPSSGLASAFASFRSWLLRIYQVVTNLRSPINDDVRAVMERLLATQDEIDAANLADNNKLLFKSAADAGMTDAEFAAYTATVNEARTEAMNALVFRTMETVRRARTAEFKANRAKVREGVAETVNARPEFRALAMMRSKDADTRVQLDREAIVDLYGADALKLIPGGVPPTVINNGTHPDILAEMVGLGTGKELLDRLIGIQTRTNELKAAGDKRSARDEAIDLETDAIMAERYGDPLSDGSIEEEARAAIHNDVRSQVIASESAALGRRTGNPPTPWKLARDWAERRVRGGSVRTEVSAAALQRHQRAENKAAGLAEKALAAGDVDEAFRQKQAQMLNHALYRAAKAAKDDVEAAAKRLSKLAKAKTLPSMDQDYLDRIHDLLEAYDFKERSGKAIDERVGFAEWVQSRLALGEEVYVPARLADADATNYKTMTVDDLIGLDDAVASIAHLGRRKKKLTDAAEQREFDSVVEEGVTQLGALNQRTPSNNMERTLPERASSFVRAFDASLLKIEALINWMDDGKPNGLFRRVIWQRLAKAQTVERDMQKDYAARLDALMRALPRDQVAAWLAKVDTPELINRETGEPFVLTKDQVIAIALNTGNAGNLQRLLDGYGWSEGSVAAVLDRTLTAADWTYVQGVWDVIDTLWPQIASLEKRLNGYAPDKVEATPIVNQHGSFAGGYYPAVYDPLRDDTSAQNEDRAGDGLFENSYTRANTRASSTKDRTDKVKRPLLLSLSVIQRHTAEVIHDIAFREAIIDADRFLGDKRIKAAVSAAFGPEYAALFRPWLQSIANEYVADRKTPAVLEKILKRLRTSTTIVGLGFRASTVIMQGIGFSNVAEMIGAKWTAVGVAKFARNPIAAVRETQALSGELRHRFGAMDRDVRENVKAYAKGSSVIDLARRYAFYGIGFADMWIATSAWIGAYNKALGEGMSEAEAVDYGDSVVNGSQGAGSAKDLSAIMRSGEGVRLLTVFYSYFSALYARQRTLGREVAGAVRERRPQDLPHLMARAWWLLVVPTLAAGLIQDPPDDDEDWGLWIAQKLMLGNLASIPGVRDIAGAFDRGFGYKFSPVSRFGETIYKAGKDLAAAIDPDEEPSEKWLKNAIETAGYVMALPAGQLSTAVQFLVDVAEGEKDPETVGEWWRGVTTGKGPDDD